MAGDFVGQILCFVEGVLGLVSKTSWQLVSVVGNGVLGLVKEFVLVPGEVFGFVKYSHATHCGLAKSVRHPSGANITN